MEISQGQHDTSALQEAIDLAGGKTALMRLLNERGHDVRSHNTISQWLLNGVPAKYCPDIEDITGVRCERLLPDVNWSVLRRSMRASKARASVTAPATPQPRIAAAPQANAGDGRRRAQPREQKNRG